MSLFIRTLKITLAATLAVTMAQLLGLNNPYTAGIITILTLLDTRRASRMQAWTYLSAILLAFVVATGTFLLLGYHVWAFAVYLFVFVLLAHRLHRGPAIAPVSVLVTHFIAAQSVDWTWQVNGLALMSIGVGFAILFNFWMPNHKNALQAQIDVVEENFRVVLSLIAKRLGEANFDTDLIYHEFMNVTACLEQLHTLALMEYDNQLLTKDDYYLRYSAMRDGQMVLLERIIDSLGHIHLQSEQNDTLAELFELTAQEFHQNNTGQALLVNLAELYAYYRSSNLPTNRADFENRAMLYHILLDFQSFLETKWAFFAQQPKQNEVPQ